MKEINVIRSELWLSAFIIIPSVLMALKQGLSAGQSPPMSFAGNQTDPKSKRDNTMKNNALLASTS